MRHRLLNRLLRVSPARAERDKHRFTPEWHLEQAEKATGLADWGEPSPFVGLSTLLQAIRAEAELHAMGRMICVQRVQGNLSARLQLEEIKKREPELLQKPLHPPLVIAGLHRTGTTLLHRLLATLPGSAYLPTWLCLQPMPVPGALEGDPEVERRRREHRSGARITGLIAPDWEVLHESGTELPEEEALLMLASLTCLHFAVDYPVPSYGRWVLEQDARPTYRLLREHLLLYQRVFPGTRWILKAPIHLPFLEELLAEIPEAKVIVLHRDPARAIPSGIRLLEGAQLFVTAHPLRQETIDYALDYTDVALERAARVRAGSGRGKIVDIRYSDLVRDPVAAVRGIFEHFGMAWEEPFAPSLRGYLDEDRRKKRRENVYSAASYGLSGDALRERFGSYMADFGIETES